MTDWSYRILKPAECYLELLRVVDQERIINALETLLIEPQQADFKLLKGRDD